MSLNVNNNNNELSELGIVNEFSKHMYEDYVRNCHNKEEITYIPNISNMGGLLPNFHNVP
ncbi:hypothetical protein RhiirA4_485394 [Rhizophagus irregularis]|uniref:Uncharacterized protein n=1 Tax=Rhizophagus irregularis TaxID=588596 RepID=A0A2I1HQ29_9GLOM|nr:hypothetical protein RhiirA4_485394 [Rhizophagus irregularis]